MTRTLPILGLLALAAPLPYFPPPSPGPASPAGVLLCRAPGQENLEKALRAVEKALRENPDDPGLWAKKGRLLFEASREARRQGLGGGLFLAAQALRKAADLGTRDPQVHLLLCRILREAGRAAESLEFAEKALTLAGKDPKTRGRALLALGAALCGRLPDLSVETERKAQARRASRHLQEASTLVPEDPQVWIYLSNAHAWDGDTAGELAVLKKGLSRLPRSQELHLYFQNRLLALGLLDEAWAFLSWMVKEDPADPVARWYLGRAWMARAEAFRQAKKSRLAVEAYGKAERAWKEAWRRAPSFEKSCRKSIAMALVGRGMLLVEEGDAPAARRVLGKAFETWPGIFEERDKFGVSYISAMETLGRRLLGGKMGFSPGALLSGNKNSRVESLLQAVDLYMELILRHPDRKEYLGFWYNNIGLALRDAGTALAGGRRRAGGEIPVKARRAWEESYRAYLKAVEFCPDDPRILNDCALVQVFHLGTEIDKAEKMLIRARDLGLSMIESEKGSWTEDRRKFLEEAVGDAWSNLGILYRRYRNDTVKAEACRAEANKYYPRNQRSRRGRSGARPTGGAQQPPLSREEWIKRRTEVIQRMEDRIEQMKESGRGEQFAGRMEAMLARMKKELEAVKKGAPVPAPRRRGMAIGRPGQAQGQGQQQGRRPGRRRGIFGARFAKLPPDERDKAFTDLIERLVSFQERMQERGREDFAKRMKTLIDKLEGLAAKGKWEEVDKALQEGFRFGRRGGGGGR